MPVIDWTGGILGGPWLLCLLVWWIPLLLVYGIISYDINHKLNVVNKENERRHQETVAALQDIAKAIRECNEE